MIKVSKKKIKIERLGIITTLAIAVVVAPNLKLILINMKNKFKAKKVLKAKKAKKALNRQNQRLIRQFYVMIKTIQVVFNKLKIKK